MIGVARSYFVKKVEPRPDFPRPVLRLSRKTVLWDESAVREWLHKQAQRA